MEHPVYPPFSCLAHDYAQYKIRPYCVYSGNFQRRGRFGDLPGNDGLSTEGQRVLRRQHQKHRRRPSRRPCGKLPSRSSIGRFRR